MPYATILNSRQTKTPVGDDPWVIATLAAIQDAANRGYTIVSSLGLNTWELVTWAAGQCGGRTLVYVPYPYEKNIDCKTDTGGLGPESLSAIILYEFDLNPSRTEFHFQAPPSRPGTKKTFWPDRDRTIIGLADILYPVSMRPGGNLESLIAGTAANKEIRDKFRVTYQKGRRPAILPSAAGHSCLTFPDTQWEYITHWTRAANGKWPGETAAQYYHDVAHSGGLYARSALFTLKRILDEHVLRATHRNIRGGFPVVSFTSLKPPEAIKLMRWRKRYVRWSFEPYGIAIKKEVAQSCRPVIYGVPADYNRLNESDRPFFQNIGTRGGDWMPENEWRHLGDLDLSTIPQEAVKIFIRSPDELPELARFSPMQMAAIFD